LPLNQYDIGLQVERMMDEDDVTGLVNPEVKLAAAQSARDKARAARWDLDIAVFLFAILILIIILATYTKMGLEVVAPVAIFGLSMVWFVGWRRGKQLYQRFYSQEISRLERDVKRAIKGAVKETVEETIEERVQRALRERWQ